MVHVTDCFFLFTYSPIAYFLYTKVHPLAEGEVKKMSIF